MTDIEPVELEDDQIVDALRCHEPSCGEQQGNHYNHELREQIAHSIRRYPNSDAEWWIGPEAVLARVEEHLRPIVKSDD